MFAVAFTIDKCRLNLTAKSPASAKSRRGAVREFKGQCGKSRGNRHPAQGRGHRPGNALERGRQRERGRRKRGAAAGSRAGHSSGNELGASAAGRHTAGANQGHQIYLGGLSETWAAKIAAFVLIRSWTATAESSSCLRESCLLLVHRLCQVGASTKIPAINAPALEVPVYYGMKVSPTLRKRLRFCSSVAERLSLESRPALPVPVYLCNHAKIRYTRPRCPLPRLIPRSRPP